MNNPQKICIICGHVGNAKALSPGSFIGEIVIFVILFVIALMTTFWILLISLFYAIYRSANNKSVCESCGSRQIIPVDSPNGMALLKSKLFSNDKKDTDA